jgi:hypothetical protein
MRILAESKNFPLSAKSLWRDRNDTESHRKAKDGLSILRVRGMPCSGKSLARWLDSLPLRDCYILYKLGEKGIGIL